MTKILFAGDSNLNDNLSDDVISVINQHDFFVYNNEIVVTNKNEKVGKRWTLSMSPHKPSFLTKIKTNVVANIANNHIFDYKALGFKDTVHYLESIENVKTVGFKDKPYVIDKDIAIYASTPFKTNDEIDIVEEKQSFLQKIKNLSKLHNKLIVNLHTGYEYSLYPHPNEIRFFRDIIDNGAYMVIGHHPHVVQGYELYNKKHIFYSIGNFNFSIPENNYPNTDNSILLSIHVSEENFKILPIINEKTVSLLGQSEIYLSNLRFISKDFNHKNYPLKFYKNISKIYLKDNFNSWIYRIRKFGYKHFVQFLKSVCSKEYIKMYIGYFFLLGALHKNKSLLHDNFYKNYTKQ